MTNRNLSIDYNEGIKVKNKGIKDAKIIFLNLVLLFQNDT